MKRKLGANTCTVTHALPLSLHRTGNWFTATAPLRVNGLRRAAHLAGLRDCARNAVYRAETPHEENIGTADAAPTRRAHLHVKTSQYLKRRLWIVIVTCWCM